jgi:hypothetical protein
MVQQRVQLVDQRLHFGGPFALKVLDAPLANVIERHADAAQWLKPDPHLYGDSYRKPQPKGAQRPDKG